MAIFRPGPLVGNISGNLGAVNFRATRGTPVVAMRSSKPRPRTAATDRVRAAIARAAAQWAALTDAQRLAWTVYAKAINRTNRLGISRTFTGRQAHAYYLWRRDPYLIGGVVALVPPPNQRLKTPAIASTAWSASGAAHITFSAVGIAGANGYLSLQRYTQYGPRAARGSLVNAGRNPINTLTVNWAAQLGGYGVVITAGEHIRLRFYLFRFDYFPSFEIFHDVVVVA